MMKAKGAARGERRPGIDWGEVHRRLEAARRAVERGTTPTPEEAKAVLRERASVLAREPGEGPAANEHLEVVDFLLAHERYAVETRFVREVYPLRELTPVPGTPPFVLGLVNVRGRILAVVDVKRFFDLPEKGLTDLNKVILLHTDGVEFGLLADAVLGVRRVALSDLQPGLPTLTGIREEYLRGIARDRTVVLDGMKLLTDPSLVVQPEARA